MSESPSSNSPAAALGKWQVFFTRLRSTILLWVLIGTALVFQIEWMETGLVAMFGFLTTIEYLRMDNADLGGWLYRRLGWVVTLIYWGLILRHCLTLHTEHSWLLDAALPVITLQGAFMLTLRRGLEDKDTLFRIFNTVFAIVYTTLMFSFMARLLYFNGAVSGPMLMLLAIMVTKFSDMGAYAFGSLFGKHKMIPHISPAKTWEGLAGAFVGSYGAMIILMSFGAPLLKPLTWGHAMILAPILCLVSVVGDLAESVLKRCHHLKDTGHKLPGIGGILDLTDSLLFTAPVTYFYLQAITG